MIAVGMIVLWGGYGVSSWGYVLIRGWDIPFNQWFSPLSPYQWPKSGDPPPIPPGDLLPSASSAQQAAQRAAGFRQLGQGVMQAGQQLQGLFRGRGKKKA